MKKAGYPRPQILFTVLIAFLLNASCSTEIDVIGPKRDVTVVYGLLEANNFRHYIRINKSFVGEDSASAMAAKPGVNEYTDEEMHAEVIELGSNGGETGRRWALIPEYITNKEPGRFSNEKNKVYYFEDSLDVRNKYRLVCTVNIKGEETKVVTATTGLLGSGAADGKLQETALRKPARKGQSSANQGSDRTLDELALNNGNIFLPSIEVTWDAASNGVRYTCYAYLYYRDVYPNGVVKRDSVYLYVGSNDNGNPSFRFSGEEWYSTISRVVLNKSVSGGDEFQRIVNDTVEFFLEIADKELTTYIQINRPQTGVLIDRPDYTNLTATSATNNPGVIEALGIFASRLVVSTKRSDERLTGRILDKFSLAELLYCNVIPPFEDKPSCNRDKGFTKPGRCAQNATGQFVCL